MALAEQATTRIYDTTTHVGILVGPGTEIHTTDLDGHVGVHFDGTFAHLGGDLAELQRVVDEIAHELMLVSTRRAEAEEHTDDRERGLAGVADLRDAAANARAAG